MKTKHTKNKKHWRNNNKIMKTGLLYGRAEEVSPMVVEVEAVTVGTSQTVKNARTYVWPPVYLSVRPSDYQFDVPIITARSLTRCLIVEKRTEKHEIDFQGETTKTRQVRREQKEINKNITGRIKRLQPMSL